MNKLLTEKEIVVVIRSAGERTLEACKQIILKQVSEHCLHVTNEKPFELALIKCFEIGMASSAKWMLTVDADVLLKDGAIRAFLKKAEKMPDHYFQIQALLHDKLTGSYREVGHRIYRTRLLGKAMQHIPDQRTQLRPEAHILHNMEFVEHPSMLVDTVLGIHDYEQYYSDIYRKTFVHAKKHTRWLGIFVQLWNEKQSEDAEYSVALRGLFDGLKYKEAVATDVRDFSDSSSLAVQELGLMEKNDILSCADASKLVGSILSTTPCDKVVVNKFNLKKMRDDNKFNLMKRWYTQVGPFRFILLTSGMIFLRMGHFLHQRSLRKPVSLK